MPRPPRGHSQWQGAMYLNETANTILHIWRQHICSFCMQMCNSNRFCDSSYQLRLYVTHLRQLHLPGWRECTWEQSFEFVPLEFSMDRYILLRSCLAVLFPLCDIRPVLRPRVSLFSRSQARCRNASCDILLKNMFTS